MTPENREMVFLILGMGLLAVATGAREDPAVPPDLWVEDTPPEPEPEPPENFAQHCDIEPPDGFNRMITEAAEATGVNPRVIALTVYRESRCKVNALGAVGEIGFGQVYPAIWVTVLTEQGIIESVDDLYDPGVNLRATGFILGEVHRYAKEDPRDALRRYNGSGPAARRYAREQSLRYQSLWGEPLWIRR